VVVDDFHVPGVSVNPAEANPPLIIDTDAVLAAAVALERFERVAGRRAELLDRLHGIQYEKFSASLPGYRGKSLDDPIIEQALGTPIAKALDHNQPINLQNAFRQTE
jgi:hypothetical protein